MSMIARVLAPLALAVALVAVFIVISGSSSSSEDSSQKHHARGGNDKPDQSQPANEDTYVVQAGDTLDGIAQKTGVGVARLQELNENVDTQALVPGSTLKLH